jgi:hypothetical protein
MAKPDSILNSLSLRVFISSHSYVLLVAALASQSPTVVYIRNIVCHRHDFEHYISLNHDLLAAHPQLSQGNQAMKVLAVNRQPEQYLNTLLPYLAFSVDHSAVLMVIRSPDGKVVSLRSDGRQYPGVKDIPRRIPDLMQSRIWS